MAANMWRVPSAEVRKAGKFGFVQDNGVMRRAHAASDGFFLFSEVGAGVKPLALVGMWHEVLNFMAERPNSGISNRIGSLPDIYWGATRYKPGTRFIGCFPVHNALQQITENVAAMAPGNTITDIGGLIGQGLGKLRQVVQGQKKARAKAPTIAESPVIFTFHYLQGNGMERLGAGRVTFSAMYDQARDKLSDMVGK